jgi:23S rRNA pseudouridine2605 synthase
VREGERATLRPQRRGSRGEAPVREESPGAKRGARAAPGASKSRETPRTTRFRDARQGSRDEAPPAQRERPARDGQRPPRPAPAARAAAARPPRTQERPKPAAAPEPRAAPPAPDLPHTPLREPQRIAKLLARAGIASRREIERMIEERRITLNGVALETPATLLTSLAGVTVDGKQVGAPAPARLFRFHKPAGVLTAERDFSGRPTIYDRLPKELPRVIPVGRLDLNTEGLLLLTTDGELKRQLELPSSKVERTYRARAFGDVTQDQLEALITGVEIEGVRYGSIDANMERRTGRNVWIEMRLTEGKNREVRRVLEYLGLQVSRLIRVAYGPLVLGDLPTGMVDEVRQNELVEFKKALK